MFLNTVKRGPFFSIAGDIRFKSKYSNSIIHQQDKLFPKVSNSNILQYKKNNIITNSKNIFEKIKSINRKDNRNSSSHQFKNLHLMMKHHSEVELARGDHYEDFYTIQNPFEEDCLGKNKKNYQLKNLSQSISPEFIVNCCERDCVKCVFSSSYDKNADKLSCCGMDCEYCEFSTRG